MTWCFNMIIILNFWISSIHTQFSVLTYCYGECSCYLIFFFMISENQSVVGNVSNPTFKKKKKTLQVLSCNCFHLPVRVFFNSANNHFFFFFWRSAQDCYVFCILQKLYKGSMKRLPFPASGLSFCVVLLIQKYFSVWPPWGWGGGELFCQPNPKLLEIVWNG